MNLLFIGPSGSGKDTQAEVLNKKFSFERISTGDLLREISDGQHNIQKIIKRSMNEGFLADNFVFGLLQTYLSHTTFQNIILSGSVRRLSQVELLDFTLFKLDRKLDKVIHFDISDKEAMLRMSLRGRADDNKLSIQNRLNDYHKDNDEIIEEYKKRGILININAEKSIEEVTKELITKLSL